MDRFIFGRLKRNSEIDRSKFDCEDSEINQYVREEALNFEESDYARNFLMIEQETSKLAGLYTLSNSIIPFAELPAEYAQDIPPFPVPSILIGQFAIDKSFQGQKLSYLLLARAYENIIFHYKQDLIAFRAVRVDTRNPKAKEFWQRQNYITFAKRKSSLFLPIKSILKGLETL